MKRKTFSILFALVLVLSLSLIPSASVGADPDPGLAALWHFDEGSGPTASDSSGNGNTGTLMGGASWTTSGKLGNALDFDGINGYVAVGFSGSLDFTADGQDFSAEAWINLNLLKDYNLVFQQEDGGGYSGRSWLYVRANGAVESFIGGIATVTATGLITTGNWHHVALTFDKGVGSQIGTLKIYVDGVQRASSTRTFEPSTSNYRIGIHKAGTHPFDGIIDEVRIWDEAVTPGPVTVPLLAGQHINVGTVSVWDDGTDLHVKYDTTSGWKITETHLAVATDTDLSGIPLTRKGNPKVDYFPNSAGPHLPVTTHTYTIPLPSGTPLYIAAHAKVVDTSSMMTTTVVSEAGVGVYGPLGVYAELGDSTWGTSSLAVATWVHGGWPSISDATWISSAYTVEDSENDSWRWFHDEITIPGYPSSGMVLATADNAEEFYFNGTLIGSDGEVQVDYYDDAEWYTKIQYPIAPQPGMNTLDFIVRNYAPYYPDKDGFHYAPNPAGLIYKAEVNYYPEETAWGDGERFVPRGNWATYFEYHVQ